jgi:hypothetical protein
VGCNRKGGWKRNQLLGPGTANKCFFFYCCCFFFLWGVAPTIQIIGFSVDYATLKFFDTRGQISRVTTQLPEGYVGLSVSPDEKSILFAVSKPQTSELALIENFQ